MTKFVYYNTATRAITSSEQYNPQVAGEWHFILFESPVSGGWAGDINGGTTFLPQNWTIE